MTDSLRDAAKEALEALELHADQYPHMVKGYTADACRALRAALAAQPSEQDRRDAERPLFDMNGEFNGPSCCGGDPSCDVYDECAGTDAALNAERYRFLRGDVPEHSTRWPRWRIEYFDGPNGWEPKRGTALDAAVDAAMLATKQEQP